MRVVLIGAGKFGSMYLSQARRTPGIHLLAVADLSPDRARASLARVGWEAQRIGARSLDDAARTLETCVTEDTAAAIAVEGGTASHEVIDVTRPDDAARMVMRTVDSFGRLDIAVNIAGVSGPRARTADYPDIAWH